MKGNTITIYTKEMDDIGFFQDIFRLPQFKSKLKAELMEDKYGNYQPVMRITKTRGVFFIERFVFRGEGYWHNLNIHTNLRTLCNKYLKYIGTEEFYDLG